MVTKEVLEKALNNLVGKDYDDYTICGKVIPEIRRVCLANRMNEDDVKKIFVRNERQSLRVVYSENYMIDHTLVYIDVKKQRVDRSYHYGRYDWTIKSFDVHDMTGSLEFILDIVKDGIIKTHEENAKYCEECVKIAEIVRNDGFDFYKFVFIMNDRKYSIKSKLDEKIENVEA